VTWVLVAVSITGLSLGLRFRVPALLVATGVLVTASIVVSVLAGFPLQSAMAMTLILLVALEITYLLGLFLAYAWSRTRERNPMAKKSGLPSG